MIEQGTEFVNQMKRKKSMLLEKAIRLSTMQSKKKQIDDSAPNKFKKQGTLDASSDTKQASVVNPMDIDSILASTKTKDGKAVKQIQEEGT